MRIFACRAVKPGDWRKCDCPKSIKRCSWETLGDIERSWEFLGVELLAFLLTTRAQQTSHSTVLIRTTLLSACWASAQRQAASHPGFRSNIAKQGVFCKREASGSVFAKATPGQGGLAQNKPPGLRSDIAHLRLLGESPATGGKSPGFRSNIAKQGGFCK